jgi:hypothetical protein
MRSCAIEAEHAKNQMPVRLYRITEYVDGTVIVDFLEAGTQRLFWRGTGTRRINHSSSPQKSADTINRWVSEILKQYPPKAKVSRQTPAGCSTPPNRATLAAPEM